MLKGCAFPNCACFGSCSAKPVPGTMVTVTQRTHNYCRWPQCACKGHCSYHGLGSQRPSHAILDNTRPVVSPDPISISTADLSAWIGKPCPYCHDPMMPGRPEGRRWTYPTKDHITPKYRGGTNDSSNLLCVCYGCNVDKDCMSIVRWYFWLKENNDWRHTIVGRFIATNRAKAQDVAA